MSMLAAFWRSTIGKKIVMAVTGVFMIAWIAGHVSGNLLMFRGEEAMNHYAAFLKSLGGLLWVVRGLLLTAVILHIVSAYQLTMIARRARVHGYEKRVPQVSTWASRTMRWGGVLLLVFIVVHLAHFTFGWIDSATFSDTDVYSNVVIGLRQPLFAAFYVVAMGALGLHIFHGAWASVRTLGLAKPSSQPLHRRLATVLAIGVWLGFTVIPVAVMLGIVTVDSSHTVPTAAAAPAPSSPTHNQ